MRGNGIHYDRCLVYVLSGSQIYDLTTYDIIIMRSLRECMHCGKEFENVRSDFCSDNCASEVSR